MSPDEAPARVRFLPADREVEARRGSWLAAAAVRAGVGLVFDCDGQGLCSTCRVRIEAGGDRLPPPSDAERAQLGDAVDDGWRLSCLLKVEGDLTVRVPGGGFAYPPELQR